MEKLMHSRNHWVAAIGALLLYFCINVSITCSAVTPEEFIKNSCGVTMYPKLCFETLSPYAKSIDSSPTAMAKAALNVTLEGAQSTLNNISKLSRKAKNLSHGEAAAVSDCVENMKDSVSELRESIAEMKDLKEPDFEEEMGNVMTWVSAALTDENTCMDGFDAGNDHMKIDNIKGSVIRSYIVYAAQLTSNALALIKNISST